MKPLRLLVPVCLVVTACADLGTKSPTSVDGQVAGYRFDDAEAWFGTLEQDGEVATIVWLQPRTAVACPVDLDLGDARLALEFGCAPAILTSGDCGLENSLVEDFNGDLATGGVGDATAVLERADLLTGSFDLTFDNFPLSGTFEAASCGPLGL